MTSITIPKNVTSCGYGWSGLNRGGPLNGALSLRTVTFEDGIKAIPANVCAFTTDSYITSVTIPESAGSIGEYAFNKCNSLSEINIPKNVSAIGAEAFCRCSGMTSVTLNYNDSQINTENNGTQLFALSIGDYAFEECSSLRNVQWTENVVSIGHHAFLKCTSLASL